MDPAEPLAQGEQVQPPVIEGRALFHPVEHKTREGAEEEQSPRRAQDQHGGAQGQDDQGRHQAEVQKNAVGDKQAGHPRHELDHRRGQGPEGEHLVFPLPPQQVDEPGTGDLHPAEGHDQ